MEEIILSGDATIGIGPASFRALAQSLPVAVKLGRRDPLMAQVLPELMRFVDIPRLATTLPASTNRREKAAPSMARMYLNDHFGCCVIAGKGHALGLWSANDDDPDVPVILATDAEIQSQYQSVCGPGDNGCVITQVLDYMKAQGFQAGGKRYKIDGYLSFDWRNKDLTRAALYLFGATTIGIDLPQEWTTAATWKPTTSQIVGGHDVTPVDYDDKGVYVSSWGRIYLMTWDAWISTKWIKESYVILAPAWYNSNKINSATGLNRDALVEAINKIGGGQVPDIILPPPPPPPPPVPLPFDIRKIIDMIIAWLKAHFAADPMKSITIQGFEMILKKLLDLLGIKIAGDVAFPYPTGANAKDAGLDLLKQLTTTRDTGAMLRDAWVLMGFGLSMGVKPQFADPARFASMSEADLESYLVAALRPLESVGVDPVGLAIDWAALLKIALPLTLSLIEKWLKPKT